MYPFTFLHHSESRDVIFLFEMKQIEFVVKRACQGPLVNMQNARHAIKIQSASKRS